MRLLDRAGCTDPGHFQSGKIEKLLNDHAAEGWRLVSSYQTQSVWKTFKANIILILERTS
ncbi:MAG: DUF4177 domain-containing protein [Actinomycetota bacterium]